MNTVFNHQFQGDNTELRKGADKSLAFHISPTGGLQHNQRNFS
jgi:hypothetical protein